MAAMAFPTALFVARKDLASDLNLDATGRTKNAVAFMGIASNHHLNLDVDCRFVTLWITSTIQITIYIITAHHIFFDGITTSLHEK